MDKRTFGRISRKKLIEAMGPLTLTVYHMDFQPSADTCADCPHFYGDRTACKSCPYTGTKQTQYIYEDKKINQGSKLSLAALKLLCLLHMSTVSGNGTIKNFSANEASKEMGCCTQTVKNALIMLRDRNYIFFCNGGDCDLFTILIKNYDEMFLPAEKNGCGFLYINEALLKALLNCQSITAARLLLRTYDLIYARSKNIQSVTMTFKELYSAFPAYICRAHIREALGSLQNVLHVIWNRRNVTLRFNDGYDAKAVHAQALESGFEYLKNRIKNLHNKVETYNSIYNSTLKPNKNNHNNANKLEKVKKDLLTLGLSRKPLSCEGLLRPAPISNEELANYAQIAVEYSPELVYDAYVHAYIYFPDFSSDVIHSRGAFLRTLVRDMADSLNFHHLKPNLQERVQFGF